jgi:hypothetical protein
MKIISALHGISKPMSEEEIGDFSTGSGKDLPIRIVFIDEKGEPPATPIGYYFDETKNRI